MVETGLSDEHLKRLPSARKSSRVGSLFPSSRMRMCLILGSLLACGRFRSKVGQKRFAFLFLPIHLQIFTIFYVPDCRFRNILPSHNPRNGLGHSLLLGCTNGNDGPGTNRQNAL